MKYPLTLRGTLAIIASTYLLLIPAKSRADLVSALIGSASILVILGAASIALFLWLRLRHSLSPQIASSGDAVEASRPERIVTSLQPIKLPPLFEIRATVNWRNEGIAGITHRIDGRVDGLRKLIEDVNFPHRGHWGITGITCELRDLFGLTSLSWLEPVSDISIRVEPSGQVHTKYIPVISSSERSGDAVEQQLTRTGDPYDLKSYHPADGSRRILWKLFAKSGALFSRLEEFSMTPEGRVVVFVLAGRKDDMLCQWALSYLDGLEELKLDIFVGSAGMSASAVPPARTTNQALELLIDSTWDSYWQALTDETQLQQSLGQDLDTLINDSTSTGNRLSRIVIFVSGDSIDSEAQVRVLQKLGSQLTERGVSPIFCVQEQLRKPSGPSLSTALSKFIMASSEESAARGDPNCYPHFLKVCAEAQWHVIV